MQSEHYPSTAYAQAEPFEPVRYGDIEPALEADGFRLYFHRDFESTRAQPNAVSYWLQLRGRSYVESKEGHFALRAGQWVVFDRDSAPCLDTDRHGVLIGFSVDPALLSEIEQHWRIEMLPGEGRLSHFDRNLLLKLWRQCALAVSTARERGDRVRMLRRLLGGVRDTQHDLSSLMRQCPGRRVTRQRQVFSRLQRVRLFLRGNSDRLVSMHELAQLTSFSPWWLSKTFKSVYGTTLQSTSVGLRIEHACDLLSETSLSIGEISHACGFDSPCSFARCFRLRMGRTASDYRANRYASNSQA